MTFDDATLLTEREILVMATSSKFFSQEILLAVSEAAKAFGYELQDNLKHFKQTSTLCSQMAEPKC